MTNKKKPATTAEAHERGYMDAMRRSSIALLQHAFVNCTPSAENADLRTAAGLALDRAEGIEAIRDLCAKFGDNDWPDSLCLRDIIRKHLLPYLESDADG